MECLGTNGVWGGVCNSAFDINDANVICKMLGFPYATAALANGTAYDLYGSATTGNKFVLTELACAGNETSVFDCTHDGEWNVSCKKKDIAGVQCATSEL